MMAKIALIWALLLGFPCSYNAAGAGSFQFVVEAGDAEVLAAPLSLGLEQIDFGDGTGEPALYRLGLMLNYRRNKSATTTLQNQ